MANSLLASMVICLKAIETKELPSSIGSIIHGELLSWIKEKNEQLSQKWHDVSSLKPFSISPLMGRFAKSPRGLLIVKDQPYWIKIATLEKEGFDVLSDYLFPLSAAQDLMSIGDMQFIVEEVKLESHPWAKVSSWNDLLSIKNSALNNSSKTTIVKHKNNKGKNSEHRNKRNAGADNNTDNNIVLRFITPTTFRRGDKNRIIPDPELVFGSLLDKWNAYSPEKIPAEYKARFADEILINRISIKSNVFDLKYQSLIGFHGYCSYTLVNDKDDEFLITLKQLASLAIFSGVGQKTTMGMGVCRAVE